MDKLSISKQKGKPSTILILQIYSPLLEAISSPMYLISYGSWSTYSIANCGIALVAETGAWWWWWWWVRSLDMTLLLENGWQTDIKL